MSEDTLKYVANDVNRIVGDLVIFTSDRSAKFSDEDKATLRELCEKLDAVQKRLDAFAFPEGSEGVGDA